MPNAEPEISINHRMSDNRHLLYVDGLVRYVGLEEECERRLRVLYPNVQQVSKKQEG